METQELVVPKSIPMTGPIQREKSERRVEKTPQGGMKRDSDLPLTFVFMFLATRDRGIRYETESERE